MRVISLQGEQVLLFSKTATCFTCPHLKNHSLQSKAEGRAKGVGVVGRWRPVKHNAHTCAKVAWTNAAPLMTNESLRIAKVCVCKSVCMFYLWSTTGFSIGWPNSSWIWSHWRERNQWHVLIRLCTPCLLKAVNILGRIVCRQSWCVTDRKWLRRKETGLAS